jgi:ABC-type Fe3+/spermidine/putrescine transport system ATPase subunit
MLEIKDIFKDYDGKPLLKGVSLQVAQGETVCLLGSSGSGKSTLLRIIAGLETQEAGQVLWNGEDISQVPVHKRHFGLMFQDYALFPHRTVRENVGFGLRMQDVAVGELNQRVREALTQVDMESFADRRVTELSGGEQQRVALARALAPRPGLLMLDEPLGALDRALRTELLHELRYLLHASQIPALYVTHDQDEAFSLADRVILLHEGRVVQAGRPEDVYLHPASTWVAHFLGMENILPGRVVDAARGQVQTALGIFNTGEELSQHLSNGDTVQLLLRPDGLHLEQLNDSFNPFRGVVEDVLFQGVVYQIVIRSDEDTQLKFFLEHPLPQGAELVFFIDPADVTCMK